MNFVGYKNRTRFRRDYIKPMVEKGLIKMTLASKPTSKNQMYIVKQCINIIKKCQYQFDKKEERGVFL